ncbi:MAG TPA: terminase gpA endonuclease subunit [Bryobacteraceae bacterium]|nr:terminase gpA endonuclease subunit [Bryobacteraceae bacterium]
MTSAPAEKSTGLSESYRSSWAKLWLPPERLPLSQWAERNLVLSSEYSARAGLLKLYGWQKEPLDAFTDPAVDSLVLMCSTQMLKTLLIQCALAYSICEDPGPAMVIEPRADDAISFSKERLAPMVRDCECLRGRVAQAKGRDSSNTILEKTYPGGSLALVGAIAPGNLARRSVRYLFADEIDKYPASAGSEGDPIDLARERTVTFGTRRKIVLCCSPTVLGRSRIGKAYDESDGRRPWVPCPNCGTFQVLNWGQVKFSPVLGYQCLHCQAIWEDEARWSACDLAEWRAQRPFRGRAGFWISHLYSPWKRLGTMVEDFLARKDDRQRFQVFVNTALAELWTEQGETPDDELLFARREEYPANGQAVIPQRGLFLTAAVDVQENPPRLEYEVVAWGRDRENWSIEYGSIRAQAPNGEDLPVTSQELWDALNAKVLQRDFPHAGGQTMPIMIMAIDTGSRPKPVYDFALRHARLAVSPAGIAVVAPRTVVPVKGTDDALRVISSVSKEDAARKRQGVHIVGIGTHCVKQEVYDLLRHVRPRSDGSPMAGAYHFPVAYERRYFEGLCSEKRMVRQNGEIGWEKLPNARNEPLDLKVYNRGAAAIFGIDRMNDAQWRRFEEALRLVPEPAQAPAAVQPLQKTERWIPKRNWFQRD